MKSFYSVKPILAFNHPHGRYEVHLVLNRHLIVVVIDEHYSSNMIAKGLTEKQAEALAQIEMNRLLMLAEREIVDWSDFPF